MYAYILLFLIPCFFSTLNKESTLHRSNLFLLIYLFSLVFFLGFRFEFGTDWSEYSKDYYQTISNYKEQGLYETLGINQIINFEITSLIGRFPLYSLSLILSYYVSGNIIFFNFVNSLIAVFGLYYYFRILNYDKDKFWGILCFAFPFLIFISTDIIRQFTSLIFILLAVGHYQISNQYKCILFLIFGTLFHISSLIFFSLFLFNKSKLRPVIMLLFIIFFLYSYLFGRSNFLIELGSFYLSDKRLASYSVNFNYFLFLYPFFLITIIYYFNIFSKIEKKIIIFFTLYGFACYIFAFLDDTVSYRLSTYLLIFYIFIISIYLNKFSMKKLFWFKQSLVFFSAIILFVWFNFSEHKHVYVPYKNVLSVQGNFNETKTQICTKYPKMCDFIQQ